MTEFKRVTDTFFASPQIAPEDVARAKQEDVTLIVNNRPDDEGPDQPSGASIEEAARAAGIAYVAIPVSSSGFSLPQVEAMTEALESAKGKVLGFCRSGTRSTLLWALSQAKQGRDPEEIASDAAGAGYNVAPVRPTMDMLTGQASD